MNADDPRFPRDVADLARLVPVPAERDLPTGRQPILKEHLMAEFRTAAPTTGPTSPRPRRTAAFASAVAALAVIAVSAGTAALIGHNAPLRFRHGHHAQVTAAELLSKIALVAAAEAAPTVRDSQFWYIDSRVAFQGCEVSAQGKLTCVMDKPHERQIWLSVSDLCRPGLLRENGRDTPLPDSGTKCPDRGSLNDPTFRLLRSLPTSPHALLRLIYHVERGHGQSADQEAFTTIGDLLREAVAPPQVTAALYRAAALIPGVHVVAFARDAIGRPGVAVAFSFRRTTTEWIFSRTTLRWLGEREVSGGKVTGESSTLVRAFVDRAGELP